MTVEEKQWVAESLGDQYDEPVSADDIGKTEEPDNTDNKEAPVLESPTTMTEAEIRQELAKLGEPQEGVAESDVLSDRRNALKAEQQKRQEELQELQTRFPVGTQVTSTRYGNGVVTQVGGDTFANTLVVTFNNDNTIHYFTLADVELDLNITDVPIESLDDNSNADNTVNTVDEYNEDYGEEEEEEDSDDPSGVNSRSAKLFGNSTPPV